MCRIVAYFGPPVPLSSLLLDPPHSLKDQSKAAREMSGGSVAGDGWGVGWFTGEEKAPPGLMKSILPLWSDLNAKTTAHAIISGSIVGHVRLASEGSEVCFLNTPLYALDQYLFTMNGSLHPWPSELSRTLRRRLDDCDEEAVQGSTDAEVPGAFWRTCRRRTASGDVRKGLRDALAETRELVLEQGGTMKANLLIASNAGFTAVRYAEGEEPNTLYYLAGTRRWHGGYVVASEPLDDAAGWKAVEPSMLVWADAAGLHSEPLDLERNKARRRRVSA